VAFTKSWTFLDGLGFLRRSLCRALTIFPLAQHNCQKISIGADKPRGYLPDVRSMPGSRIALETGTHSPWVTRPRSDRGPCPERALDWGEPAQRRSPGCADFGSSGAMMDRVHPGLLKTSKDTSRKSGHGRPLGGRRSCHSFSAPN